MNQKVILLSLVLGGLLTNAAAAQSTTGVSPGAPDPRILSLHAKVDDLFRDGEISRAYFIYRNELVPLGDKYAQYMVGYMHLTGLAVNQDKAIASAWYRLAAERGTPEFIELRDQLLFELTEEERARSDEIYRELRHEYNDLAVLLTSIKRHQRALRNRNINDTRQPPFSLTAANRRNTAYYEQLGRELERQLQMLSELGDFPDMETDPDDADLEEIERRVTARIAEMSD